MPSDTLTKFANVLYNEATEEKKGIVQALQEERRKRLNEKDKELENKLKREVKKGIANLEHQKQLSLARREIELHKALIKNRTRCFDAIFGAVIQNLRAFTQTPEYADYLKAKFADVQGFFSQEGLTVCTAMEQDIEHVKASCPFSNVEFQCARQDLIGGFTLKNEALGYFADCTLASKVEEQKDNFCKTSGLIMD